MQPIKRKLYLIAGAVVVLAVVYIAFFFIFLDLVVDFWWFGSLGFETYFWLRLLYKYLILGGFTLLFFLIFFFHFWIASKFLGINRPTRSEGTEDDAKKSLRLIEKFQTGALEVYIPLSLIMSIIIALPFYQHWEQALLYIFAPRTGIDDPVFGHDVGFYMFSYPIYQLIQKQLLGISVCLFFAVAFLYWIEHRLFDKQQTQYPRGVKIHLGVLAAFVCLFVVWGFLLDRFSLLYYENHEPVFYGPGFVEIRYQLPLIWLSIAAFLLLAYFFAQLFYSHGRKGHRGIIVFSIAVMVIFALREVAVIPDLINTFIVQPNPVKTEKPFMRYNITATLHAYALDKVKTVEFVPTLAPLDDLLNWEGKKYLDNVPLWDRELLKDVYFQLQGLRPYYNFPSVDEDRYLMNNVLKQVNLSARELNIEKLPQEAQNWENKHLRYTHGYGAVMSPAAQPGGQPFQWFLRGLDLYSPVGIKIKKPDIYYGLEDYPYAIVPNKLEVVGIAGSQAATGSYSGKGGIPVRSLFRKMLLAFYFRDEKIFFSVNITDVSRLRFRRNITDRIDILTPYLTLDSDPYLVAVDDSFYWIQDAYTISNWYPVSKRSVAWLRKNAKENDESFNYIRNSVKIVINAYDGTTHFYIADPDDPIIQAYDRAYPGFFKRLEELPPGLDKHLRYPRDIYYYQMDIYKRYHQVKPELFYEQAETWEFPELEGEELKPYYLTTELQGCAGIDRFIQLSLLTPIARDNLSAFAAAGIRDPETCGSKYSPSVTLYKIRKDIQLDGPVQIGALIDQDPVISEQLTLWDQHGSTVVRGRMILLPVGRTVLYLQPLYLISTDTKIPELARVIVATGSEVMMQKSAGKAFKELEIALGADPALVYPEKTKQKPKSKPEPKPEKPSKPAQPPRAVALPEPVQEAPVETSPYAEPPAELKQPEIKEPILKFTLAGDISFSFGKSKINSAAAKKLAEIAAEIRRRQDVTVKINGYTDSKGSKTYNQRLSVDRAEAVRQWLIKKEGIASAILISKGFGEQNPLAPNAWPDGSDNPEGRAKNRRVEIVLEQ